MMKKMIAILLAMIMVLSLTARDKLYFKWRRKGKQRDKPPLCGRWRRMV